ncbi:amino acid adenylation domain-containing protein [uncultured Chitinophaga sp.]|jgi:amino acid adenylation domain|uniref:non-ribosomal peptide synthetase n=1 Tax=uncultured Chitinophaga sp. TaxID=339340 RepID=UPI002618F13F|nr:amino acid adenylation domain-containing protein [uncultured Chitinophaga sp.]
MNNIVKLILELADQQINIFLEDGKLKIDAPNGIALDAVISRIKAHKDEIIEYLSGNRAVVEIAPAPVSEAYVLSSSQRRLWVLSQFENGSLAYNIPAVFEFDGMLDMGALSAAFDALIERHESLRTVFRTSADGAVRQYILPAAALGFRIGYHDFTTKDQDRLREVIQSNLSQSFDLATGPLLKADLYQTGLGKWFFSYVMHHIISDGWSMEVLIKELLQLYQAYVQNRYSPLSPLRIHYKDYAVWQQEQLKSADAQRHKAYWLQQFSGELPVLELPADKPRPLVKSHNGASIHRQLEAAITSGLRALCQSSDSTLFMGLLAAVKVLLYRYTGQEDIIIGSPVAGREHSDLEDQIGFYVNTLALRTQFSGTDSFQQLLSRIKQVTLDAYEHQSYPFDALVEELDLQRDLSRSVLFDVMLVLQHQSSSALVEKGLHGLQIRACDELPQTAKFDLQFSFVETGDQLALHLNYNTDIYHEAAITQLLTHFEQLLSAIVAAPQQPIATLSYLDAAEQTLLLETFNDTAVPYAPDRTAITLFEEQVLRTPDHTALLVDEKTFSYRELNEMANRLAHYLQQTYAVTPDDLVGIRQERNEYLVVSLLGVLKSGAAYVPIDPGYPQERIDYIVADSRCKVVLDDKELQRFLAKAAACSTADPSVAIQPGSLAYIIYTSGSTGRPKGVMITQGNLAAFMDWCKREFGQSDYEVVMGVTSICFDLSVFEIFYTLVSGKQLRLLPDALSIPQYLNSPLPLLINTVPSVISSLLDSGADLSRVNVLNMAGEPIPLSIIRQLDCERIAVRNLYGPSEDTTYSTVFRLGNDEKILIGRPVSNTRIYILNDHHQLQPAGVAGEICISGSGLARGYLYQPELTAAKFIPHPFMAGERLYKTGDLGKWLPDGNIAFLGRKDDQVKIRGYRIEPGEIARVLEDYTGVSAAVVTAGKDANDDKMLVAYVVGPSALDVTALRSWLNGKLPHYMQPANIIRLDALPLLPNGKLNRKVLPHHAAGNAAAKEYIAPANPVEERLVQVWQEILGKERIGVTDNFFELGGHSLKAISLLSVIHREYGISINVQALFRQPTIRNLADHIANAAWLESNNTSPAIEKIII